MISPGDDLEIVQKLYFIDGIKYIHFYLWKIETTSLILIFKIIITVVISDNLGKRD